MSEQVLTGHAPASRDAERRASRAPRRAVRLTNTPVRLLQQAHTAALHGSPQYQAITSRLRTHFRLYAQNAAAEAVPLEAILAYVRQAYQTAERTLDPETPPPISGELVLLACDAVIDGYTHAQKPRDEVDQRVRETALGLLEDALRLLEEEKQQLARELHDETGQILTATLFKIDTCLAELPRGSGTIARQLRDVRETLLAATHDLHRLVYSLRPPMLDELGLVPTLRWLLRQFQAQYKIVTSIKATDGGRLADAVEMALFRIVQEALTNVAKHARASSVAVVLEVSTSDIFLTVRDDGQGFDQQAPAKTPGRPSLGLLGMRERVRQLGGSIEVASVLGAGTTVQVTLSRGG